MTDNASSRFGTHAQQEAQRRIHPSNEKSDIIVVCTPTTTRSKETIFLDDGSDSDLNRVDFPFPVIDRMYKLCTVNRLDERLTHLFSKESGVPCQILEQVLYKGSEIKVLRYTVNKSVNEIHSLFSTALASRDTSNVMAQAGIGAIVIVDVKGTHSVVKEICKQLETATRKSVGLLDIPETAPLEEEVLDVRTFTHNAQPVTVAVARKFLIQNERGTILIPSLKGYVMTDTQIEFTSLITFLQQRGVPVAGKGADELRDLYNAIVEQEADAQSDEANRPKTLAEMLASLGYPRFCYKALARHFDLKVSKRHEIEHIAETLAQHIDENDITVGALLAEFIPLVEARGCDSTPIISLAAELRGDAGHRDEEGALGEAGVAGDDEETEDFDEEIADDETEDHHGYNVEGDDEDEDEDDFDEDDDSDEDEDVDSEEDFDEEEQELEPVNNPESYFLLDAPTHEQRLAALRAVEIEPANERRITVMRTFEEVRKEYLADLEADQEPAQPLVANGAAPVATSLDEVQDEEELRELTESMTKAQPPVEDDEAEDFEEDEDDADSEDEDEYDDAVLADPYSALHAEILLMPLPRLRALADAFGIDVQEIVANIDEEDEDQDAAEIETTAIADTLIERIDPEAVQEVAEMFGIELQNTVSDAFALYVEFFAAFAGMDTVDELEPAPAQSFISGTVDSTVGELIQVHSRASLVINFVLNRDEVAAAHLDELSNIDGVNYKFPFNLGAKNKPQGAMILPAKQLSDIIEEAVDASFLAPEGQLNVTQYANALAHLMNTRTQGTIYQDRLNEGANPDSQGVMLGDFDQDGEATVIPMSALYSAHVATAPVVDGVANYIQTVGVLNVPLNGFWAEGETADRAVRMVNKAIEVVKSNIANYSSLDVYCALTFTAADLVHDENLHAVFADVRSEQERLQSITLTEAETADEQNDVTEYMASLGRDISALPVDLIATSSTMALFEHGGDMSVLIPCTEQEEVEEETEENDEE